MDAEKEAIDYYNEIKSKTTNNDVIEIINEIIEQEAEYPALKH